jgi:hypothetical protein
VRPRRGATVRPGAEAVSLLENLFGADVPGVPPPFPKRPQSLAGSGVPRLCLNGERRAGFGVCDAVRSRSTVWTGAEFHRG